MESRGQIVIGILLLIAGLVFLAGELFNVNLWAICWPGALIFLGAWLILRPRMAPNMGVNIQLFGDVERYGNWRFSDEEIWMLIGDVRYDLTRAEFPPGETKLRVYGLIGDVDIHLPANLGASVGAWGLINQAELFGRKYETFLSPIQAENSSDLPSETRVRLETYFLIGDVKVVSL